MTRKLVTVAKRSDLAPGSCTSVEVDGIGVALVNIDGTFYALDNTCPHAGGPLGEGRLEGECVVCPWHGWRYSVKTGLRPENPDFAVACFPVRIVGDDVQIETG